MENNVVLTMRGISMTFPGVKALDNVDFTLRKGEIHALMGENGAGKSTLIKVLTGVYPKDGGEVHIKGVEGPALIRSPQDAQNVGISTVYQEITLCPNLTVAENMYIGRTKGMMTNWKAMNHGAEKLLSDLGIPASPPNSWGPALLLFSRWWLSLGRWIWSARSSSWMSPPPPWMSRRFRSSSV